MRIEIYTTDFRYFQVPAEMNGTPLKAQKYFFKSLKKFPTCLPVAASAK